MLDGLLFVYNKDELQGTRTKLFSTKYLFDALFLFSRVRRDIAQTRGNSSETPYPTNVSKRTRKTTCHVTYERIVRVSAYIPRKRDAK